MIRHRHILAIGKGVRTLSRLRGGSGSALPGLVVEKLDPRFVARVLGELPRGIIIVTGTNGKTTTTKMVVKLLTDSGLRVCTNRSGSNFTRGIIASLLAEVNRDGLLDADIAVLELDEAYAAHFVKLIRPRYCLLLNVMRDQLDRFGEIDHTAQLLQRVAEATTDGVVLNRDDPLIRSIGHSLPSTVHVNYFGLSDALRKTFPSDQALYGNKNSSSTKKESLHPEDVILKKISASGVVFAFGDTPQLPIHLNIDGVYNLQNAAAALCLARLVLRDDTINHNDLLTSLSTVQSAFGRGETIQIHGQPLEIVLVKNPAGFRLALSSYSVRPARTMIAINDNYADGRDMSWLWDVDFASLGRVDMVSGSRAYDMALRLQYDEVEVGRVTTSLSRGLNDFLSGANEPRRIFCTYTAMMYLRKKLAKQFDLRDIDV